MQVLYHFPWNTTSYPNSTLRHSNLWGFWKCDIFIYNYFLVELKHWVNTTIWSPKYKVNSCKVWKKSTVKVLQGKGNCDGLERNSLLTSLALFGQSMAYKKNFYEINQVNTKENLINWKINKYHHILTTFKGLERNPNSVQFCNQKRLEDTISGKCCILIGWVLVWSWTASYKRNSISLPGYHYLVVKLWNGPYKADCP